jgi:hypothetical protein
MICLDLISDALPFGRLWYGEANAISDAIGYAKFYSRSHDAVIRVYDSAGNVIESHEQGAISANRILEFLARESPHRPKKVNEWTK